jgi:hypothetical protein
MALPRGIDNGTAATFATDVDTQQQVAVFSVRAFIAPGQPGEVVPLPIGPSGEARFQAIFTILIGGRDENPDIEPPDIGTEIIFTGKDSSSEIHNGRYRVNQTSMPVTGARGVDLIIIKGEKVSDEDDE